MTEPVIVVKNLSHIYQLGTLSKAALVDISLEIERGSCVAIIGITGSGKSTLVQHFNGLLRPTSGTVIVDGIDVSAKGVDLRVLRQRVSMLFQFPEAQLFGRTVFADVAFGPERMNLERREVRARVIAALETVGLPNSEYGWRSPFELSGGQMRRVALAGVLAMSPAVLVLDEPTVGLDARGREEFYSCLRRVQEERGVTIVLVSHDMTEVASLADRLFVLHNGYLVMQGTPRRGCASFFCKEATAPGMVRSWSTGNSGSRRARRRLGRGSLRASRRAQEQKAQQELAQLAQSGILARLLVQEAALLPLEQALVACLQPSWFPLIVTDGGAQSQHRIDMRALEAACQPL